MSQVVTISVYGFFLLSLFSRQLLEPRLSAEHALLNDPMHAIDVYVPLPTLLQLLLSVGWLKVFELGFLSFLCGYVFTTRNPVYYTSVNSTGLQVAEVFLNPLGSDDDDFDTSHVPNARRQLFRVPYQILTNM